MRSLSRGDHWGCENSPSADVTLRGDPPADGTIHNSRVSPLSRLNAIHEPSLDQLGKRGRRPRNVICFSFPVSTAYVHISPESAMRRENAIRFPSGDQEGKRAPGMTVFGETSPRARISTASPLGSYTMCFPSGDQYASPTPPSKMRE